MKYIYPLIFLAVVCPHTLFSQAGYYLISNPDTAYSGLDLIYDDGFHVLGNAWNFNPPYNGIPIEGEYSFGNACFFMSEDGIVEYKEYFDNNETSPSLEGFGRVPGTFFFATNSNDRIILPYTKHFGIVQCENIQQGKLTDRLGIIEARKENTAYSTKDTLYNMYGLCESQRLVGYFAERDSFLLILKDNYDDISLTFNWYDSQLNLLSETRKAFITFEPRTTGLAVDDSGNLIFLGWDSTDNYNLSLLKTSPNGDSLTKINVLSSTHPFTSIAIAGGQGTGFLVAAYRYNMDYSGIEYFLLCFDDGLNEKWRKQLLLHIKAIAALDGGQGYLIVSVPLSGQPSPFNVGYLNGEGELVSSEEYGEENDIPGKVKILNDSLFAVIGTKFIGYQNSTGGNPYASIFVLVDTIQKLVVSNVEKKADDDVQIKAFPNPARHRIRIEMEWEGAKQLVLLDALGQELRRLATSATTVEAGLEGLPKGLYYIQAYREGRRMGAVKFLKH